jgi:secretion/DNA translocation related TadE-like protein
VTIVAAVAAMTLLMVVGLILQLGAVEAARHRAQTAADLAALAAADAAVTGTSAACAAAAAVVRHAAPARVTRCALDGWDAVVGVRLTVRPAGLGEREVVAVARAGPAEDHVH